MGVYDDDRDAARELIREFGEQCSWLIAGEPIKDPSKPWVVTDPEPSIKLGISIAFFPLSETDLKVVQLLLKTEVPTSLEKGYMEAVDFKPALKDLVIRADGRKMRIVSIGPLDPNGEGALIYQVVVRE